ncbi:MAG: SH3 domain-containing protein, partial [Sarcina sp.]
MKKNKIAGLLVASALVVGATGATHAHADAATNHKTTNIKGNTNKILLAATTHSMTKNAVVVNGNGDLSLRSAANSQAQIVSNVSVGEMLNIQSYSSNWYKVTVKETGATGFISSANLRYIESGLNSKFADLNNNGQVINVSSAVNVRSEATINSNISTTLTNGTSLKIVGKQGEWYKVIANGVSGFVYGEYVSVGNEISPSTASATVNAPNTINKTSNTNNSQAATQKSTSNTNATPASKTVDNVTVSQPTTSTSTQTTTTTSTSTTTQTKENTNTQKENLNVKPSKVNSVDSHSTPVSFLAIPNTTSNTQNEAEATGSITLTIYQTNTDRALANENVTINGQNYTTNAQGKVKISSLNVGAHKLNLA